MPRLAAFLEEFLAEGYNEVMSTVSHCVEGSRKDAGRSVLGSLGQLSHLVTTHAHLWPPPIPTTPRQMFAGLRAGLLVSTLTQEDFQNFVRLAAYCTQYVRLKEVRAGGRVLRCAGMSTVHLWVITTKGAEPSTGPPPQESRLASKGADTPEATKGDGEERPTSPFAGIAATMGFENFHWVRKPLYSYLNRVGMAVSTGPTGMLCTSTGQDSQAAHSRGIHVPGWKRGQTVSSPHLEGLSTRPTPQHNSKAPHRSTCCGCP